MSVDLTRSNMLSTDPMYNKPIGLLQTEILRLREENEKLAMANHSANAQNEGLHIINQLVKLDAEHGRLRDRHAGLAVDDFWAEQLSEERARRDVIRLEAFRLRAELAATQALLEKERADARRADEILKVFIGTHDRVLEEDNQPEHRSDRMIYGDDGERRMHKCGVGRREAWFRMARDMKDDGNLFVSCGVCGDGKHIF
ncbi:hypothetical protein GCK72_003048 [Caenorhabditis remanei]|uniref:Uncharacterized protein n=1 Tax=Caenorhabditis remanei TaxID=31234 RepID=A0A6A5HYD3_CAERE|nr:hypothetical protein GCK72_003048 [Caenorhabditis remanei]KAF1771222.1 hypothetical protein GCK72_003048 [Caenorhabditis remanei]